LNRWPLRISHQTKVADCAARRIELAFSVAPMHWRAANPPAHVDCHPLSKAKEEANRKKRQVRGRVEHVFGAQQTSSGGRIVRTIGIVRARAKIGLQNLVYNIRRLVTLERMAGA
jgi:hypothetical protein